MQATSSRDDSLAISVRVLVVLVSHQWNCTVHSMPPLSKVAYGKRKLILINSIVEQKLAKELCLPELPIQSDNTPMLESDQSLRQYAL